VASNEGISSNKLNIFWFQQQPEQLYRQLSLSVKLPLAGVVNWLLGSYSQVTTPLNFLMYLYWMAVSAGRSTVMLHVG